MLSPKEIQSLNHSLEGSEPKDILTTLLQKCPNTGISFSGAEDVVLIEIASKLPADIPVFTLDTGRLHPQTYEFIERVRDHYGIKIELLYPDAEKLQQLVSNKGLFSFYQDGHHECCSIRKVEPLRLRLASLDGWITGQRRDQSPTRAKVPVVELDTSSSSASHPVIKINPLANWSSAQIWNYIRMFDVPFNSLHESGFVSIGCEPCTRPVGPNQHEREGRWWWEEATIRECGLHRGNLGRG